MGRLVLDAATAARLLELRGVAEIVDEAGNVLAVCRPAGPSPEVREMARELARRPFAPGSYAPFTDEEIRAGLEELANGDGGITTPELLAKLRSL